MGSRHWWCTDIIGGAPVFTRWTSRTLRRVLTKEKLWKRAVVFPFMLPPPLLSPLFSPFFFFLYPFSPFDWGKNQKIKLKNEKTIKTKQSKLFVLFVTYWFCFPLEYFIYCVIVLPSLSKWTILFPNEIYSQCLSAEMGYLFLLMHITCTCACFDACMQLRGNQTLVHILMHHCNLNWIPSS